MLRKIPVLLAPLVLLCPMPGYGGQSDPSNFDECIIDAMRGVSSDVAARAIIESCRNLFPESEPVAAPPVAPASVPAPAAEIDTPIASGEMMAFTRDPSVRRASTMGHTSSTRRPTFETIRSMICSNPRPDTRYTNMNSGSTF